MALANLLLWTHLSGMTAGIEYPALAILVNGLLPLF